MFSVFGKKAFKSVNQKITPNLGWPNSLDCIDLKSSVESKNPKCAYVIYEWSLSCYQNAKCNERSAPLWKFCGDNSSLNWIIKFRKKTKKINFILCNFSVRTLWYLKKKKKKTSFYATFHCGRYNIYKKIKINCPPKHRKTCLKSCS